MVNRYLMLRRLRWEGYVSNAPESYTTMSASIFGKNPKINWIDRINKLREENWKAISKYRIYNIYFLCIVFWVKLFYVKISSLTLSSLFLMSFSLGYIQSSFLQSSQLTALILSNVPPWIFLVVPFFREMFLCILLAVLHTLYSKTFAFPVICEITLTIFRNFI